MFILLMIVVLCIIGGWMWWRPFVEKAEAAKKAAWIDRYQSYLPHSDRPMEARRIMLIDHLKRDGWVIQNEGEGGNFVYARAPKPRFSIVVFFQLMFFFGVGFIYLLWWITRPVFDHSFVLEK